MNMQSAEEELIFLRERVEVSEKMLANARIDVERLNIELKKAKQPESRSTKIIGILSTLFILVGSPTVSLFVRSILGWVFYSVSAVLGMIYTVRKREKPIFIQFAYYLFWNIIAIISRLT